MVDAWWWDVGLVQDSQPSVTECLHVTPWLVEVKKEVKERKCGGLWMLDVPSGNVKRAWNLPTQWTARRRGEAPPSGLDAQWPEPGGDERHGLERGPWEVKTRQGKG